MEIDIRHIAKLARLKITDEELPRFEKEMADIVGMVENLPDLPDSGALIDPDHDAAGQGGKHLPSRRAAEKRPTGPGGLRRRSENC